MSQRRSRALPGELVATRALVTAAHFLGAGLVHPKLVAVMVNGSHLNAVILAVRDIRYWHVDR
jgi:hypothetical protein